MFRKKAKVEFIKSCPLGVRFPEPLKFEIAFTGRSNVGKSSLINTMTKIPKIAKVSSRPGCTQAVNYFKVDNSFYLVDLPGYGFAKAPKKIVMAFGELMSDYFGERAEWIIGVQIIDIRRGVWELDMNMMDLFYEHGIPFLAVVTKVDKLKKQQRLNAIRKIKKHEYLQNIEVIPFSSITGEGIVMLNKALDRLVEEKYLLDGKSD